MMETRDGRVMWAVEEERAADASLAEEIARLLARAPIPRWPGARVIAAVGPSLAQAKRVAGLPPLDDVQAVAQILQEGASRFFLRNGSSVVVARPRLVAPGIAWTAAIEQPSVDAIIQGCRLGGVRLEAIVPTVGLLGRILLSANVLWQDGDVLAELGYGEDAAASQARRIPIALRSRRLADNGSLRQAMNEPPESIPQLQQLGAHGWRYADAYGAATCDSRDEPAILARSGSGSAAPVPRWRARVAIGAVVAAMVAALIAPGIRARMAARTANDALQALAAPSRAAARDQRELARITAALDEVSAFEQQRRSHLELLDHINRALPSGSALLALRVDSASGSVVVLGPRAADVLRAFEHVPDIATPEIVGPVTREMASGRQLDRVALQFHMVRAARNAERHENAGATR
ncbi:MAG TPA: hypothetical protein VFK13_03930 [Gemmatimonadaceae bacterium]|nr:hypothetical protein [Gemmatimonadaceae bacterium]